MRHIIQHQGMRSIVEATGLSIAEAEAIIAIRFTRAVASRSPYILHMLGIPGSGKSTFVQSLDRSSAVTVSFDSVMEDLLPYQKDKKLLGPIQAFANWEIAAREIGYEILFRSLEGKYNIIFDHGGTRADHAELLAYVKQHCDYTVRIVAVLVPIEIAIMRAKTRDRHVPSHYFHERIKVLNELLPRYKEIADEYQEIGCDNASNNNRI